MLMQYTRNIEKKTLKNKNKEKYKLNQIKWI